MTVGSRVAVVGAYGAGKTTLVAALSARLGLPVAVTGAMRDPVRGVPTALEDCGPEEVFQLALRRFGERVRGEASLGDAFVSDGSVLHEWIYLETVAATRPHGPTDVGPVARRAIHELVQGLAERYDLLVHVPPTIPLPPGAPIDATFQAEIDRRTRDAVERSEVPVVTVVGDPADRTGAVVERLRTPVPRWAP